MSIEAIQWAKKQRIGSPMPKYVLVSLADYADEQGSCFPSQARLAQDTEISVRSIARHLKFLESGEWIKRTHRVTSSGFRTSDRYWLNLKNVTTCQTVSTSGDPSGQSDRTTYLPNGAVLPANGGKSYLPPVVGLHDTVGRAEPSLTPSVNPQIKDSCPTASPSNELVIAGSDHLDEFHRWYEAYPRHEAKAAGLKAWKKAVKRVPNDVLVAAAKRFRDDPNREKQFTPLPGSWLNAGRWDDDPLPARRDSTRPTQDENVAAWGSLKSDGWPRAVES